MEQSRNRNSNPVTNEFFQNDDQTPPVVSEKRRHLLRTAKYWLGTGVGLMAISFGINFLFYSDGGAFVTTSMYILTTLGTACITKALVNIFN